MNMIAAVKKSVVAREGQRGPDVTAPAIMPISKNAISSVPAAPTKTNKRWTPEKSGLQADRGRALLTRSAGNCPSARGLTRTGDFRRSLNPFSMPQALQVAAF
jgi:hypothetical protein